MSRLTIDITEQQHQTLKAMAALQGKSIEQYILERLFPAASDEEQAMQQLKALLEARLADADTGKVSARGITEVAQELISARGVG